MLLIECLVHCVSFSSSLSFLFELDLTRVFSQFLPLQSAEAVLEPLAVLSPSETLALLNKLRFALELPKLVSSLGLCLFQPPSLEFPD